MRPLAFQTWPGGLAVSTDSFRFLTFLLGMQGEVATGLRGPPCIF